MKGGPDRGPHLGTDAVWLIVLSTGWAFASALAAPFVNAFLWTTRRSLVDIGWLELAQFGLMALGFIAGGWLVKRAGIGRVLRLAVLVSVLSYGLLVLLGERGGVWAFLTGAFIGVGQSLYWLTFYLWALRFTETGNRDWLNGAMGTASSLTRLAAPGLGAFLIAAGGGGIAGYHVLFLVTALLFSVVAFISLRWREGAPPLPRYRPWSPIRFALNQTGGKKPGKPAAPAPAGGAVAARWGLLLAVFILLGVREGVFLFFPALLSFLVTEDPWLLGQYASLTALAAGVTSYVAGRWGGPGRWPRRRRVRAGVLLSLIAGVCLIPEPTYVTVLLFGVLDSIGYSLVKIPVEGLALDVIAGMPPEAGSAVEFTVAKETLLNVTRWVVAGIFLLLALRLQPMDLRWLLVGVVPFGLLLPRMVGREDGFRAG